MITVGMVVEVVKPAEGGYSALMQPYLGKVFKVDKVGPGPCPGETYAYTNTFSEIPFSLNWLKELPNPWPTEFVRAGKGTHHMFVSKRRRLGPEPQHIEFKAVTQATNPFGKFDYSALKLKLPDVDYASIEYRMLAHYIDNAKPGLKEAALAHFGVTMSTYDKAKEFIKREETLKMNLCKADLEALQKHYEPKCACTGHDLLHFGHKCGREKK